MPLLCQVLQYSNLFKNSNAGQQPKYCTTFTMQFCIANSVHNTFMIFFVCVYIEHVNFLHNCTEWIYGGF